jgi:hypothetical protein
MKKLHTFLTNNVDKFAHLAVMYMIADLLLTYDISFYFKESTTFVAVLTFLTAMGKEIFDKITTFKWSFWDFVFTFGGGITAILINLYK